METRANYVLIGAFALAGFFGIMGFFLVFSKYQFDRQFAYYEASFDAVSGLSRSADVRFAGLPVGQVLDVSLAPDGRVRVMLEVDRATPVRADSVAIVDSSGITGVAFVSISPGSQDAALINDRDDVPQLDVGRSTIQSLTETAPRILEEALTVVEQVNQLLGAENQGRVAAILDNIERSSGDLSAALDSFAGFTETVDAATETFTEFSDNLAPILRQAENTLESLEFAIDEIALVATEARYTFEAGTQTLNTADAFVAGDLSVLVTELSDAAASVRNELEEFSREAQVMFGEFTRTSSAATQRIEALDPALARLDPLLARADTTLQTVERMSDNIDGLVTGDGAALIAEARDMVAIARDATTSIARAAETDLPLIMADIRAATEEIRGVVATVGEDLSSASGQIDAVSDAGLRALDQVTGTFANANITLDAINRALVTGESTLQAAERAFVGADRVINEDIGQITEDLRDVLGRLGRAVDSVADDIPEVTADLRRTAESAARAFDDLSAIIRDSGAPVREFTTTGLPNISQLARETRGLISNLDRLTRQIERDPTRFFLNRQTPEFRR